MMLTKVWCNFRVGICRFDCIQSEVANAEAACPRKNAIAWTFNDSSFSIDLKLLTLTLQLLDACLAIGT